MGLFYMLETHYWLGVSLKNWLWPVLVAPPALAALGYLAWPAALLASLGAALLLAGAEWARRRQYVVFAADEQGANPADRAAAGGGPSLAPLCVDEQLRCRAFGRFAVEDKQRHVIHADAQLSFVRTREHIVMAYVRPTRFLLLAASLKKDVGWWYVFMTPKRLLEVQPGILRCGFQTHVALRICCRAEEDRVQEVYLGFADVETRQRVIDDLRRDAPSEAFG
jgi:hypothetical protein